MEFAGILIVVIIWLIQFAAKQKKQDHDRPAAEQKERMAPVPVEKIQEKRREQMARVDQWRAAKTQQDDARQVHSINVDSCENKLQSLKTLYDAGIFDREEYTQRVARVKAKHAHGVKQ